MKFERNAEMIGKYHAVVRAVLQYHSLTEVGDGVVEADLIEAVLAVANSHPAVIGTVDIVRGKAWINCTDKTIDLPNGKYSLVAVDLLN